MMNWSEHEREVMPKPRPIILPLLFWLASILLLIFILASLGCAQDRYLSQEEDAEMRAHCEPAGGCAIIPNPVWEQIRRVLGLVDA